MAQSKSRVQNLFRFGLRTFLIVITLSAVGFGWLVQSIRNQQAALDRLQQLGVPLDLDSDNPFASPDDPDDSELTIRQRTWQSFCGMLGVRPNLKERFDSLHSIYLPETTFEREDFLLLRYLPRLEHLTLGELHGNLNPLKGLEDLSSVEIQKSTISSLSPLRNSGNLTELKLPKSAIRSLDPIGQLSNLRMVNFRKTDIDDISAFRQLKSLDDINLAKTRVADISPLAELPNLKILNLSDTQVTDLSPIGGREVLSLNVSGLNVDDFSILKGTKFTKLNLNRTNFSGFDQFGGEVKVRGLWAGGPHLKQLDGIETLCAFRDRKLRRERRAKNRKSGKPKPYFGSVVPVVGHDDPFKQDDPVKSGGGFGGKNLDPFVDESAPTEASFAELIELIKSTIGSDAFSTDLGIKPYVTNSSGIVAVTDADNVRVEQVNRGMKRLEISTSPVESIEPLRRLEQLIKFKMTKTNVTDLRPIFGLRKLNEIGVFDSPIENLDGMEKLFYSQVRKFELVNALVVDAEPIVNLRRRLKELSLSGTPVSDISWIYRLRSLVELDLSGTAIFDLEPIADLPSLLFLDFSRTQVTDLSPLKNFRYLRQINLAGTDVSDLTPLTNVRVDQLILSDTKVTDLSPIFGRHSLDDPFQNRFCSGIAIDGCPIRDLSSIERKGELVWLNMARTDISDLKPLENTGELTDLDISFSKVTDLSPIMNLNLELLMIESVDLSKEEIARFRAANPQCKIEFVQRPLRRQEYTPLFVGGAF